MEKTDIVPGQTYKIRQWDDMVKEYGEDYDTLDEHVYYIEGPEEVWFHENMRPLCGELYTPTEIDAEGCCSPFVGTDENDDWRIWWWMLER